jgi:hypothetical protein
LTADVRDEGGTMSEQPTPDPMRVLVLVQAAERLAAYLDDETGAAIDAVAVLDALADAQLTLTPAGPGDVDATVAAYLTCSSPDD